MYTCIYICACTYIHTDRERYGMELRHIRCYIIHTALWPIQLNVHLGYCCIEVLPLPGESCISSVLLGPQTLLLHCSLDLLHLSPIHTYTQCFDGLYQHRTTPYNVVHTHMCYNNYCKYLHDSCTSQDAACR